MATAVWKWPSFMWLDISSNGSLTLWVLAYLKGICSKSICTKIVIFCLGIIVFSRPSVPCIIHEVCMFFIWSEDLIFY